MQRCKKGLKFISFVLSVCMLLTIGGIVPRQKADAAVDFTDCLKSRVDLQVGQTESVLLDSVNIPIGVAYSCNVKYGDDLISVSRKGIITAKKYGTAVVEVTWRKGAGNSKTAEILVDVVPLKSGYYYMNTLSSPCYMSIKDGNTSEGATLTAWRRGSTSISIAYYQIWRVKYVGRGYYTIRCSYMPKYAVAIDKNRDVTTVLNDVVTETVGNVPKEALWYIMKDNIDGCSSYYIQSVGEASGFLRGADSSNEGITISLDRCPGLMRDYPSMRWMFTPTDSMAGIDYFIPTPSSTVFVGKLAERPIIPIVFSIESLSQECTFMSSDGSIAIVNSDGVVRGIREGNVVITVASKSNPNIYFDYSIRVVSGDGSSYDDLNVSEVVSGQFNVLGVDAIKRVVVPKYINIEGKLYPLSYFMARGSDYTWNSSCTRYTFYENEKASYATYDNLTGEVTDLDRYGIPWAVGETKLSEEDILKIATNAFREIVPGIDVESYRIDVSGRESYDYDKGYLYFVEFTRYVDGIATDDQINIRVRDYGFVEGFSSCLLGKFRNFSVPAVVTSGEAEKAAVDHIRSEWIRRFPEDELANIDVRIWNTTFTRIPDGRYAVIYDVHCLYENEVLFGNNSYVVILE